MNFTYILCKGKDLRGCNSTYNTELWRTWSVLLTTTPFIQYVLEAIKIHFYVL